MENNRRYCQPETGWPIPSLDALLDAVQAGAEPAAACSCLHGPRHWRDVARVGAALAQRTAGADPAVAFCFGLLHDTQRRNDGADPDHGPRAAAFAARLLADGLITLTGASASALLDAIERHTTAPATADPLRGCCWDADRLTLWRVAIVPAARFLSTGLARNLSQTEWSLELIQGEDHTWEQIERAGRQRDSLDAPPAVGDPPYARSRS